MPKFAIFNHPVEVLLFDEKVFSVKILLVYYSLCAFISVSAGCAGGAETVLGVKGQNIEPNIIKRFLWGWGYISMF